MDSPSNNLLTLYEEELKRPLPMTIGELIPPFCLEDTIAERIKKTQKALTRSLRLKNRVMALTNAYFLGSLINNADSATEKFCNKRQLTRHYGTMAENVYDIFEPNPLHLLHTTSMTVQNIKKLKRSEILHLRNLLETKSLEKTLDFTLILTELKI